MESIARPAILDGLAEEERRALLSDAGLDSLQAVFAAVPDPRALRGRRHGLPFLLTCLVAALLCTCDTTAAVGEWCAAQREQLARRYPRQRALTPTGALFRWLLPRLPVAELEWALAGWVQRTRPAADREPLALDGKTVRGATVVGTDRTRAAPHLLSVSGHASGETFLQARVDGKSPPGGSPDPGGPGVAPVPAGARAGDHSRRTAHPGRLLQARPLPPPTAASAGLRCAAYAPPPP